MEFLTPLIGSGFTRAKVPDFTASVRGVSAQKVRYLELLLNDPWLVRLDESLGFPLPEPKLVRLPNASGYIAQKLLSYSQRKPSDRAKDVLYIHDTIETFGRALPTLRQTWLTSVRPQLHKNAVRVIELAANNMFRAIDDTIRNAARMTPGRDLSPQLILEVCELGVREIFR